MYTSAKRDFSTLFGICAGFALVVAAIFMSGGAKGFVDVPSVLIVLGGTFAITIACYSLAEVFGLFGSINALVFYKMTDANKAGTFAVSLAEHGKKSGILALQEKEREIERGSLLAKGIKLIVDGTTIEEVEQVIAQDIQSSLDRNKKSAAILRRAADIAPAMGLIGTLIGLVQMLSSLDKPADIGPFMAVALLTTLYGALLAYMVLTPLASKIERNSDEQFLLNKIYLIALVCIGKQESPRKLERLINTVLPPSKKLKTFKEE
jgi:chemotaxis protein MotA